MWKRIILKYRIGKIAAVMTRMKKETRQQCISKIINALRASKTFPENAYCEANRPGLRSKTAAFRF